MKMIARIVLWLSFVFGTITLFSVAAYGALEYFGFLFVEKTNVTDMMGQLLKVSYLCFLTAATLFITHYFLTKR